MHKYENLPIHGCVLKEHLYMPEYSLGYRLRDFGYPQTKIGRNETFGIVCPIYEYHLEESPKELASALKEKGFYPLTPLPDLVDEIRAKISPYDGEHYPYRGYE